MLKNYIKIALRNISKHKGYSLINISGLAIGIALSLLIFLFVKHELSYDQFHENSDRIYGITLQQGEQKLAVTPSIVGPALSQQFPEIENWVRLYEPTRYSPAIISRDENTFQEDKFFYADSSFFEIFSYDFIAGNPGTVLDQPRSIVLTRSTAAKLFGNANPVGEFLEARIFSSVINFEVTGVIEDVPSNSHIQFDYIASLSTRSNWSELSDSEVRSANFFTYIMLNSAEAEGLLSQKLPEFLSNFVPPEAELSLSLIQLPDIYLSSGIQDGLNTLGNKNTLFGFSAIAFLILLIAITNYINLATARSSNRAGEVGVRKTLGAHRAALIKQFYTESALMTLISVGIAIAVVELFKGPFFELIGQEITLSLFSDSSTWGMLTAITLITALAAGGYPALVLSSFEPQKVLKGIFGDSGSDSFLRKGLVTFQFAASIFLILGTTIIYQQTDYILNKDIGFDKEEVIILPAGDNILSQKHELLKSEVLRTQGVISSTYMSNVPGSVFGGYNAIHAPLQLNANTQAGAADSDVLETLKIELVAGTGFPENPNYSPEQGYVYLINETLANTFNWTPEEAIGKEFDLQGGRQGEIVGVIKDFNFASLKEEIQPLALFVQPRMYDNLLVKISSENIGSTISSLGALWNNLAPHRPFEFQFLDQNLDALYKAEERTKNIFTLFAGFAIFIACLGLFGLSSYTIEKRTKEIGIRKVLGASLSGIVGLISFDFLKLVGIGFVIAAPIGWFVMNSWLQDFAYRIEIDLWVFIISGGAAILVAFATVSWQSIKAALANPVNSLKSE
jgi:putative ABC transport system permease protein